MLTLYLTNTKTVQVTDLADASRQWATYRRDRNLSSSTMAKKAGEVWTGTAAALGRLVACVSYNGRVWTPESHEPNRTGVLLLEAAE